MNVLQFQKNFLLKYVKLDAFNVKTLWKIDQILFSCFDLSFECMDHKLVVKKGVPVILFFSSFCSCSSFGSLSAAIGRADHSVQNVGRLARHLLKGGIYKRKNKTKNYTRVFLLEQPLWSETQKLKKVTSKNAGADLKT